MVVVINDHDARRAAVVSRSIESLMIIYIVCGTRLTGGASLTLRVVEGMFGFVADELWFHVALHILLDLVPSLLLVVNLLSFRRRSSNIGRAAISDNHDLFSTRRLFPNMPLHLRLNQELSLPLLLLFLS